MDHSEKIEVMTTGNNMKDYEEAYRNFDWKEVEKVFSWYETGKVNAAYEAIDRHAESDRRDKIALYYSDANREEQYTFLEMKRSRTASEMSSGNWASKRVTGSSFSCRGLPELYFSFLGAIKIGAVVGPLFEAFMEAAVRDRLENSEAVALVTTPELLDRVPVKELPALKHVILVGETGGNLDEGYVDFYKEMEAASPELDIEWVDREDPMLIHYTSGSTGKPKGVLHVHNAMIQHYQTGKWVLDLQEDDIYWCTADPGWVTGTSYGVFAPWLNGVTNVIRGGRFNPDDWYQTLEKYGVTVWYSAPTAFRMLMGAGEEVAKKYDLSKVRHILSVGEPLNPEVVRWGLKAYGRRIHDNWWHDGNGGNPDRQLSMHGDQAGFDGASLPGVEAAILDDEGNELPPYQMGNLAIRTPWPSMMRAIWNNKEKYDEYFRITAGTFPVTLPIWMKTAISGSKDELDDVINTSGERVGPFEVESKLVEHPAVAEAGVIGKPDPVRGEIIKAFISLRTGYEPWRN